MWCLKEDTHSFRDSSEADKFTIVMTMAAEIETTSNNLIGEKKRFFTQ